MVKNEGFVLKYVILPYEKFSLYKSFLCHKLKKCSFIGDKSIELYMMAWIILKW